MIIDWLVVAVVTAIDIALHIIVDGNKHVSMDVIVITIKTVLISSTIIAASIAIALVIIFTITNIIIIIMFSTNINMNITGSESTTNTLTVIPMLTMIGRAHITCEAVFARQLACNNGNPVIADTHNKGVAHPFSLAKLLEDALKLHGSCHRHHSDLYLAQTERGHRRAVEIAVEMAELCRGVRMRV